MSRRDGLLAAVIMALAAAIRFPGLGDAPLWIDEAASVLFAWDGPAAAIRAATTDAGPPFFYLLLGPWMSAFGHSELAVRALPAVLGVLTAPLVFGAARRLVPGPRWPAAVAGLAFALSPLAVYYARQCRMYSLAPLLGVLALLTLHRALQTGNVRAYTAHAATMAAGCYTHSFFLFALPVAPIAGLLLAPADRRAHTVLRCSIAVAAAFLAWTPWLPILLAQSTSGASAWIRPIWEATPPSLALPLSIEAVGASSIFPEYLRELAWMRDQHWPWLWEPARWIAVALMLACCTAALRRPRGDRIALVLSALLVAVPLLIAWLLSFAISPIYLVGRYELIALPALLIVCARGMGSLGRLGMAAAVIWLALAGATTIAALRTPVPPLERSVAERASEVLEVDDTAVATDYGWAVQRYYARRLETRGQWEAWPPAVAAHPGWFDPDAALAGDLEARALDLVRRAKSRGGRVALISYNRSSSLDAVNVILQRALVGAYGPPVHDGGLWFFD